MSMTTLAPHPTATPDFGKELAFTVVSRWHRKLSANPTAKRSHWRTKTVYFDAVASLVATGSANQLTWKSIVDAAAPHGSRSTFYEVAGAHARHPLVEAFIDEGHTDSIQVALEYRRSDAVAQLLDETKVWSYWSFRERMVKDISAAGPLSPEALEAHVCDSLTRWSRANQPLAAALGHTPPICAVEDLMLIRKGRITAVRAVAQLTDHLRRTM
ncbi:hypothetical protein GCM10020218_003370 [Dactylosporangium vinaceum]|uniref:TetR family transcriptional regulator n=1 Tax=Dactylosporangium vinaceum TaxID=53362 RepID=A0ABV5LZX3_9ACTN|nr:hypothetical protein [Dactylosporangium vinaceum]